MSTLFDTTVATASCSQHRDLFQSDVLTFSPKYPFVENGMGERELTEPEIARMVALRNELEAQAKSICAECPLLVPCTDYSLSNDVYGVAAGMNERERRAMRRDLGIKSAPVSIESLCGTYMMRQDSASADRNARRHRLNSKLKAAASQSVHTTEVYLLPDIPENLTGSKPVLFRKGSGRLQSNDSITYQGPTEVTPPSGLLPGASIEAPHLLNGLITAIYDLLITGAEFTMDDINAGVGHLISDESALHYWVSKSDQPTGDPEVRAIPASMTRVSRPDRVHRGRIRCLHLNIHRAGRKSGVPVVRKLANGSYQFTREGLESWATYRGVEIKY